MKVQSKPAHSFLGVGLLEISRVAVILLLLAIVGLALYLPWLGLSGDDWWFLAHLSDGDFLQILLNDHPARPMVAAIWVALWNIFGLRPWLYYAVSFASQWLTACAVFIMLRGTFRWTTANSFAAAALVLLYPVDTARVYLSTLAIRLGALAAATGALLWLYAHTYLSRSLLLEIGGMLLMAMSLLTYETPFALIVLAPFALARIAWRGWRDWLRQIAVYYLTLALYLGFRIWTVYVVGHRPTHFYVAFRFSPDWLLGQFTALLSALAWKGWAYALKSMLDLGLLPSSLILMAAMALLFPVGIFARHNTKTIENQESSHLSGLGFGLLLVAAGFLPVAVTSLSVADAVGTIDARFLNATALGFAVISIHLWSIAESVFGERTGRRNLVWITMMATSIGLALMAGLGIQRENVRSWQIQMRVLKDLQKFAPSMPRNTVIVLLDVPSRPFDIRFYYPYTQLVSRFYNTPTLQVLPWQAGFPPNQQQVVFGSNGALVITEIVQHQTAFFSYDHLIGYKVDSDGHLVPIIEIPSEYLLREASQATVPLPEDWLPASSPVPLKMIQTTAPSKPPPETAWRKWLLAQLQFITRDAWP